MEDTNTVTIDSLKEQGFTDEDLQEHLPQSEPSAEDTTEPITETEPLPNEPTIEPVSVPDRDNVSKHVPYDRFKEVNDKNKLMAAELAALKAQQSQSVPQPQPTYTQPQPQQIDIAEEIATIADQKVKKALNIIEDIDTLQYSDPALYLKYVKNVAKEEYRLESQYEQQQTLRNQNVNFVNELKSQQDFPVLYQFALTELDELPGKQSRAIGEAFSRIDQGIGNGSDHEAIRKFTAECRSKMNGTSQQAPENGAIFTPVKPATSPLDKTAGLPKAQNLSGAKTSVMSWAQVEGLIQSGDIDKIPKEMLAQIDKRLLE